MYNIFGLRPIGSGRIAHKYLPITASNLQTLFNPGLLATIKEEERYNIFYTAAHCKPQSRDMEYQEIIPIDLDDIDLLNMDQYILEIAAVTKTDYKKCIIVATGNGLQYIIKTSQFSKEVLIELKKKYKLLCDVLTKHLNDLGLPGVADSTALAASKLLRLPHTENRKPMHSPFGKEVIPKKAILLNDGCEIQDVFMDYRPIEKKSEFSPPDADYIMQNCLFLKEQLKTGGKNGDEPTWYAALGLTSFFANNGYTHRVSCNYEGYSYEETEVKAEHARSTPPRTCEFISTLFKGCSDCPWSGLIKTPLQLKPKLPENEDFSSDLKKGFSLTVYDKKSGEKKKVVRDVYRLYEYFNHLYKYYYLAGSNGRGRFMIYQDSFYTPFYNDEIKAFAQRFYKPICTKGSEREEFLKMAQAHNLLPPEKFNAICNKHGKINLTNGVLDIASGKIEEHNSNYLFTYKLPYNYDANAKCTIWDKLILDLMCQRKELVSCIEEFLGYCVSGMPYRFNRLLVFKGQGENGKTTILNIMQMVLGKINCSNINISDIKHNHFKSSRLEGKLANFSEEESVDCFQDGGIIKALTGKSFIDIERKFGDSYSYENRAKLIISYNEIPFLKELNHGMKRRFLIIPFDLNLQYHPQCKVKNVDEVIEAELPGILNRALDGLKRLLERGDFVVSTSMQACLDEMVEQSMSSFDIWFQKALEITGNPEDKVTKAQMHSSFEMFAMGELRFPSFMKRVAKALKDAKLANALKALPDRKIEECRIYVNENQRPSGYRGIRLTEFGKDPKNG